MATPTSIAAAIHGNQRRMARRSTAIATASDMAIRGNYHGSPRQLPRQFPRTPIYCNFHGKPRHPAAIRGNFHGDFRTSQTAIYGNLRQFSQTAIYGDCHGKPRHSATIATAIYAAIATVISTANNGKLPRQFLSQLRAIATLIDGNFHGNPRQSAANANSR